MLGGHVLPKSSQREAHGGAHGTGEGLRLVGRLPGVVEVPVRRRQDALDGVLGTMGLTGSLTFVASLAQVVVVAYEALVALSPEV